MFSFVICRECNVTNKLSKFMDITALSGSRVIFPRPYECWVWLFFRLWIRTVAFYLCVLSAWWFDYRITILHCIWWGIVSVVFEFHSKGCTKHHFSALNSDLKKKKGLGHFGCISDEFQSDCFNYSCDTKFDTDLKWSWMSNADSTLEY